MPRSASVNLALRHTQMLSAVAHNRKVPAILSSGVLLNLEADSSTTTKAVLAESIQLPHVVGTSHLQAGCENPPTPRLPASGTCRIDQIRPPSRFSRRIRSNRFPPPGGLSACLVCRGSEAWAIERIPSGREARVVVASPFPPALEGPEKPSFRESSRVLISPRHPRFSTCCRPYR